MSPKPHGQLRRTQLITTFGPGSLLDLPKHSVLVGGLDEWSPEGRERIAEPRLEAKLRELLGVDELRLFSPPVDSGDPTAPPTGIRVWHFPEWFVTQDAERGPAGEAMRSRRLVHRNALERGLRWRDENRRWREVVAVRFVRACRRGHIGDIDWYGFVHPAESRCRGSLWIDERGTSGDLSEVWIRCECGAARRMTDAATMEFRALGTCDGYRPWLGRYAGEGCREVNRLLVRTASNAYFPQIMSVISLPQQEEALNEAIDRVWDDFLQFVESIEELARDRQRPTVAAALSGFTDEEVWAAICARRGGGSEPARRSVKQAEFEVLAASRPEVGDKRPDGTFYARSLPHERWDVPWMGGWSAWSWSTGCGRSSPSSVSPASRRSPLTSRASLRWASSGLPWPAS